MFGFCSKLGDGSSDHAAEVEVGEVVALDPKVHQHCFLVGCGVREKGGNQRDTKDFAQSNWKSKVAITGDGKTVDETSQGLLLVELCPPKRYVKVLTLVHVDVTYFGNRVFAEVIRLR